MRPPPFGLGITGLAVAAGFAAAAAACSHAPPSGAPPLAAAPPPAPCAGPEPLRVTLQASLGLNPGERGEPLAVVVRLYQLKGTGKLQEAGFDDLLDRDKEALGGELVAENEVTINPGEKLEPPVIRSPEALYVAAVALFRRPAGTTWRTAKRLMPPDPQYCHPPAGGRLAWSNEASALFILDENRIDLR